ncbi:Serine/arginine-rich splicing factor [Nymphaea thermarum]|nr:Serine/arginine-rich splicing factor [Nymphaea thermarum]
MVVIVTGTTADDLFPLFDRYGKVVDIFIPRDKRTGESRGFAFVRYKYAEEAQMAVDRLDGRTVDGREIMVQFAKYGPNAERIYRDDHRYRDDYRDRDHRRRSRSRSAERFDRHRDRDRGRERISRHRSKSRSLSPDYHKGRDKGKITDEPRSRSASYASPSPRRSRSPRRSPSRSKSPPSRNASPSKRSPDRRSPSASPAGRSPNGRSPASDY